MTRQSRLLGVSFFFTLAGALASGQPSSNLPLADATHNMFGTSLTRSDDGSVMVIGTFNELLVWNPATDSEIKRIAVGGRGFQGRVFDVSEHGDLAALSDQQWGATGAFATPPPRNIYVVDLATGAILWDITPDADFDGSIEDAAFAESGDVSEILFTLRIGNNPLRPDFGKRPWNLLDARTGVDKPQYAFIKEASVGGPLVGLSSPAPLRRWFTPYVLLTITDKDVMALTRGAELHIGNDWIATNAENMGTGLPWACAMGGNEISFLHGGTPASLANQVATVRTTVEVKFGDCSPDFTLVAVADYSGLEAYRLDPGGAGTPLLQHRYTTTYSTQVSGIATTPNDIYLLSVGWLKRWSIASTGAAGKKADEWKVQ